MKYILLILPIVVFSCHKIDDRLRVANISNEPIMYLRYFENIETDSLIHRFREDILKKDVDPHYLYPNDTVRMMELYKWEDLLSDDSLYIYFVRKQDFDIYILNDKSMRLKALKRTYTLKALQDNNWLIIYDGN